MQEAPTIEQPLAASGSAAFVLMSHIYYDSGSLVGLYSSLELAQEAATRHYKTDNVPGQWRDQALQKADRWLAAENGKAWDWNDRSHHSYAIELRVVDSREFE